MKRWILIAGILAGLAMAGYVGFSSLAASRQSQMLANLQTSRLEIGDLTATIGATGRVRARQSATLTFQTSGMVEQVVVSSGEQVFKDQLLATLEHASLPSSLILAEADLTAAQQALDELLQSDSALAQAQLSLAQAREAYDKAQRRYITQQGGNRATDETITGAEASLVLAEQQVDQAQDNVNRLSNLPSDDPRRAAAEKALYDARRARDQAKATLNWYTGQPTDIDQAILQAELRRAEAAMRDAEREWDRLKDGPPDSDVAAARARVAAAQSLLNQRQIVAPFAGTVTNLGVMTGDLVAPGQMALQLADLTELIVEIELSEVDVNRVQVAQPVRLTFDAVPERTYQGEVIEIGLAGNAVQDVVSFPVKVLLVDADGQVRPGMTAAVNIVTEEIEQVLLVPNRAVRVVEGQRVVYVLRAGELEKVPIRLGASSDLNSQVLEGDLQAGDPVVLNPPAELENNGPPFFVGR
jgi:HlyD family secretion protein